MTIPMIRCRLAVLICVQVCLWLCIAITGCRRNSGGEAGRPAKPVAMPVKDINQVLRDHDDELMKIPGVVGVYVGLMADEKTPCLKVMASRKTPELDRQVPKSLEGYPVVVEESGVIRPMRGKS